MPALRGDCQLKTRAIPISTARLQAVLEWLQLDADGSKKPEDALVFSDEAGEPVGSFRTAWVTAVLKAQDVTPEWRSYNWTALTPQGNEEFRRINLHWHDLRHEYASRLVEKGVPLAQVRDLLGHAFDHHDRALRQSEAGESADSSSQARERQDVRSDRQPAHRKTQR